jgi:penicillin-binding protein 1A
MASPRGRYLVPALVVVSFVLLGLTATGFRWLERQLPSPYRLKEIQPAQKTVVYDLHGDTIYEFYKENRDLLPLAAMPKPIVEAILATEDRKFYQHYGIDFAGMVRAGVRNLKDRKVRQGGSTITQQLARNLFLTHDRTWKRKVQETVLALRIERLYSKDEILELYLNQIYFGQGAYGVQAAARAYFGKDVSSLTLAECALLCGLPGNPRDFDPRVFPEAAMRRRRVVLNAMKRTKAIDEAEFKAADGAPLAIVEAASSSAVGPYFVEEIRQHLIDRYGARELYEGGLKVFTSLDLKLQAAAEEAVESHLTTLEREIPTVQTKAEYAKVQEKATKKGDKAPPPKYLQGALICIEARTGYVLSMVGGRSFAESPFNRAVQAHRQPGSAFKPFIYTAAIDNGFRASDLILDSPVVYDGAKAGEEWRPQNYSGTFAGPMTLRYALKRSQNVPAVKLMSNVRIPVVASYARRMGITSPIQNVLSVALGTSEVHLDEITAAYSPFPNEGLRVEPLYVLRVEDRTGRVLETNSTRLEEAISAETAAIMTSMLEDVIDSGTAAGARARGFTRPAGGKTGTTDDYNNGWFIGFTPDLLAGVWVGYDSNEPIGPKMEGARVALPIWTKFMIAATADRPPTAFSLPPSLVTARVCAESGMLVRAECPQPYSEVYKAGTQPDLFCNFHGDGGGAYDMLTGSDGEPTTWGTVKESGPVQIE